MLLSRRCFELRPFLVQVQAKIRMKYEAQEENKLPNDIKIPPPLAPV
jgi:hypothetical protein